MVQNYIIVVGIVEILLFGTFLYFIIMANIFVNALKQEINDLHLFLPVIIRDIRYDLVQFNKDLSAHISEEALSPEKIGMFAGKIFTEIIFFRFSSLKLSKKFLVLSVISKAVKLNKLLKPLFLFKTVR